MNQREVNQRLPLKVGLLIHLMVCLLFVSSSFGVTYQGSVSAGNDDCTEEPNVPWDRVGAGTMYIGRYSSTYTNMNFGIIFRNINIPQGATINSASLSIYITAGGDGQTVVSRIYGFDEDNVSDFSASLPSAKTQTSAFADWNIPGTADQWQQSSDISSIVQEIVNRSGWNDGNGMGFVIGEYNTSGEYEVRPENYEDNVSLAATLTIEYSGNQSPTAVISANPTSGDPPLTVNFDGTGSSDPDSDPLTYDWQFGDGGSSTSAITSHEYTSTGIYTVTLTVNDGKGGTDVATTKIYVGMTVLFEADFNSDAQGFTYADDAFRGTSQPSYASGAYTASGGNNGTGALEVTLGAPSSQVNNMSGGWSYTFNLAQAGDVELSLMYNLTQSPTYEADEQSQSLVSIDGTLYGTPPNDYIAQIQGDGQGTGEPPITTGWQSFTTTIPSLSAGNHTITVGGFNNKATLSDEYTTIVMDYIVLTGAGGNSPPEAQSVSISGTAEVGQVLTGSYTYYDAESDPESGTMLQWFRADDGSGTNRAAIAGATNTTYTLAGADDGKYIQFEVTPRASSGTMDGSPTPSSYTGPVAPANTPPQAQNVSVSGTAEVGQVLTGSYTYYDAEGDPQSGTTFQWYRADDGSGTNRTAIAGATSINYTLTGADEGKFIQFEVTPRASSGVTDGSPTPSSYTGPVVPANTPPEAQSVSISGTPEVGQVLTGSYTYYDADGDPQGATSFKWFRSDDGSGTNKTEITGETNTTYTLVSADDGKYITFEVTPRATAGVLIGAPVESAYFGPIGVPNSAPEAQSVSIGGTPEVGQVLTGSYTYYDADGDPEGATSFKWYRSDDGSGTNKTEISGATNITYTLVSADDGKYITFEVTPRATAGVLVGSPAESAYFGPIGVPNSAPEAQSVSISGTPEVGQVLTGTYTYYDVDSDPEGATSFKWFRSDDGSGTNKTEITGETNITYTLVSADDGKYITFEVTPRATAGVLVGTPVESGYVGPVTTPVNSPPEAQSVSISGTPEVGQVLTGSYTYYDADSDPEGATAFKWFRSDDGSGTNKTEITGETNTTYTLVSADDGKYITFEVTPRATAGVLVGTPVESGYTGPVTTPTVTVTSPNGGETLIIDAIHNITWTSTGTVPDVKLEYSTDNGSNYTEIIASTPNTGTYSWTVPSTASTQCLVRVSDAVYGDPVDVSDATFTIEVGVAVTVTSPNGGETLIIGSTFDITWLSAGTLPDVKIEYSTDNGTNYTDIIASTPNTGTYPWTVPNTPSTLCLIGISDLDDDPTDVSDAVFTIESVAQYVYPEQCGAGEGMEVDGSVKIGAVTDPTEKLEVDGRVKCDAVVIGEWTLRTPDYVFGKEYKLRTIEDIEKFIKEYQHLPEVPSAEEMKQKGVNLSELNMTLLKKIEELHLYIIEQNKKIEKLEEEMEEVKK